MNIHHQRTVKGGAQKRREKKLATLQRAAPQFYSLTNYFSCTSEHGQPERSGNVDDKIDESREGIITY